MFEGVVIDVAIRTFLKSPSSPKSNIINFKVKLTFIFSSGRHVSGSGPYKQVSVSQKVWHAIEP